MLCRSATLLAAVCFCAGVAQHGAEVVVSAVPDEACPLCAPPSAADDFGLLQLGTHGRQEEAALTACTASGSDPYASGALVGCCGGLQSCLADWQSTGVWSYRCYATCSGGPAPAPAPPVPAKYYPHFDTSPDYLGIAARARGVGGNPGEVSDNFYLVVSDQGGCAGGCDDCCSTQKQVAQKMKAYVEARKAKNPNSQLLFVLAGGDNFYWTGAGEGRFSGTWADVYDDELTSVPWFAVFGNHDYGDSDPGSACPYAQPRFTCDSTNQNSAACGGPQPYSTEPQDYNSNQLNTDKGGVDGAVRANFHMPDYTYYYSIPDLDFELIAMDWNVADVNGLGGLGTCSNCGAQHLLDYCGTQDALISSLTAIKDASTELLNNRAAAAASKNVAILGHYPDEFQGGANFRQMYLEGLPAEKQDSTKVFNFFGHTHVQECRGTSGGECVDFLTGGSGGCCGTSDTPAGFVAVAFGADGAQVVECFLGSECTLSSYAPGMAAPSAPSQVPSQGGGGGGGGVCHHTRDDPRCPGYAVPAHGGSNTSSKV